MTGLGGQGSGTFCSPLRDIQVLISLGLMETMMELKLSLNFACCCCVQRVTVTLQCSGPGMAHGSRTVATVNVPCPSCGTVNRLEFDPCGTIRAVAPYQALRPLLEPSLN